MHPSVEGRVELDPEHHHAPPLTELVRSGRRLVRILSDDLHPDIFDDIDFSEALSKLARDNRHSQVHILVKTTQYLVGRGHHLTQLYRRLPSLVTIRVLTYCPNIYVANYMLVDSNGLYYDPRDDDKVSFVNDNDAPMVKHLAAQFDELWEKSETDTELRSLGI